MRSSTALRDFPDIVETTPLEGAGAGVAGAASTAAVALPLALISKLTSLWFTATANPPQQSALERFEAPSWPFSGIGKPEGGLHY
jgi:hypothetical protein